MKLIFKKLLAALLLLPISVFGADYYGASGDPATGSALSSSVLRAEYSAIATGFTKVAPYTGNANKAVIINSGATGQTVTTGTLALAGNFATTGAFNTTLIQGASVSLTLPTTDSTLAILGAQSFTGLQTFNAGISIPTGFNVTGAGTAQVTGFSTISGTTLTGTLSTAAQPNVTSLGTLTGLTVTNAPTFSALTATRVPFAGTAGLLSDSASLTYTSGTGTLTATTFSGALTGNASTATALATARAIYGNNFDGTAALAQIIASTYGGTGNGFTKFSGPTTAEKTFTLPDASATLLYSGGDAGTPSALVGTNITGTAAGLTAGNVTTNANLTGHVTSVGNAAVLGSFTVAQLNTAVSDADVAILGANSFTGAQTLTSASPQLTLGVLNTTSGGIKFFGSTSGNVTLAPNVAAGASVTVTLPATSVTLNAAGDLTGNTLNSGVTASSLTSVGTITSGVWNAGAVTSSGAISASTSITLTNAQDAATILQVSNTNNGASALAGVQLTNDTQSAYVRLLSGGATPGNAMTFQNNAGAGTYVFQSGTVTMSAYGAGTANFSAAGLISSVSDENYKIKDGTIADPISMLMALEPGYFYGKPEANMGDARQLGFYAQNVRKAIGPEAAPDPTDYVKYDDEGKEISRTKRPWGYFDRSVLAVVVEAAKNQESRLRTLEARFK